MTANAGLGQAIREARERAGMSLRAFAAKVGVSPPFMSDVEHGRRAPSDLAAWARALGADEHALLARSEVLTKQELAWLNARPELLAMLRSMRRRDDRGPARSHPPGSMRRIRKAGAP